MSLHSIDRICSHAMLCLESAFALGAWETARGDSLLAYADSRPGGERLHRVKRVVFEFKRCIVKPSLGTIAVRLVEVCGRMVGRPLMYAD